MPVTDKSSVYVHPHALVEASEVGPGTRVWAFAHVMTGAVVGRDCNIGDHAFIESGARLGDRVTVKNGVMIWNGVTIEDDVFVGPGAIFTNDRYPRSPRMIEVSFRYSHQENWLVPTVIHRGASIGAGAVILCGRSVGRHAVVGAGAVVTLDIPDHRLVIGNPARLESWVCVCGVPLREGSTCRSCHRRYRLGDDSLAVIDQE